MSQRSRNKISCLKSAALKKQKKGIATRLIQISLIMDDYVYKNKEITAIDAKQYIEEVSTYKAECVHDPRSLQVIEKLTRCMNTIINTHIENSGGRCELNNTKEIDSLNICVSPVFSFADEGRTQLSQTIIEENNIGPMEMEEFADVIDLCGDDEELDKNIDNLNVDNINVEARINQGKNKEILDVSKATETHIITTNETEMHVISPDVNNSQSILSFQNDNQDMNCTQSQFNTNIFQDSYNNQTFNKYVNNSHSCDIITEIDYSQSILDNSNNIENIELWIQTQKDYPFDNIAVSHRITPNNTDNGPTQNFTPPIENVTSASNKVYHNILRERDRQELDNINKISDLVIDKKIPVGGGNTESGTKKKRAPRKKKINENSKETDKTKEVKRRPRKQKENAKTNSAKDKNITNNDDDNPKLIGNKENSIDYSWIENLKYVREISSTENHKRSKDLSVNFWENFSLPPDWDESEFMFEM